MKLLIDTFVAGVLGFCIIAGGLYTKDNVLSIVKDRALEKSHGQLINMSHISKSLTRRVSLK